MHELEYIVKCSTTVENKTIRDTLLLAGLESGTIGTLYSVAPRYTVLGFLRTRSIVHCTVPHCVMNGQIYFRKPIYVRLFRPFSPVMLPFIQHRNRLFAIQDNARGH